MESNFRGKRIIGYVLASQKVPLLLSKFCAKTIMKSIRVQEKPSIRDWQTTVADCQYTRAWVMPVVRGSNRHEERIIVWICEAKGCPIMPLATPFCGTTV